jgi:hypothetical protein
VRTTGWKIRPCGGGNVTAFMTGTDRLTTIGLGLRSADVEIAASDGGFFCGTVGGIGHTG